MGGALLDGGPDAVDVVVFVEGVEEVADFFELGFGEFGDDFGDEADFAGDDGPAVSGEPFGDGGHVGAFADEFGAGGVAGDVVVLFAGEGLEFVGAGFDGGGFAVDVWVGVVGFDESDAVEDEFVGAGGGELALAEEDADFGGGAVGVVGVDLDDDGDVVGGAAFVDDVLEGDLFVAGTGAAVDGTLDGVFGDAFAFGFFDGGEEPGVHGGIGVAHFSGEGDFADQFGVGLPLFESGDESFRVQPLSSHSSENYSRKSARGQDRGGWAGVRKGGGGGAEDRSVGEVRAKFGLKGRRRLGRSGWRLSAVGGCCRARCRLGEGRGEGVVSGLRVSDRHFGGDWLSSRRVVSVSVLGRRRAPVVRRYGVNRRLGLLGEEMGARMKASCVVAAVLVVLGLGQLATGGDSMGHSRHGSAFDTGLRQKPWKMEGIGKAPFPITTKVPEVQQWFDQGNALLQSFWYEEAERSFRWCLKLDPDCAMAYWGLARCGLNWSTGMADYPEAKRFKDFLKEAVRRKDTVSERERMYIEAWDAAMGAEMPDRVKVLNRKLHELVLKYPDDVEALTMLAMFSIEAGNTLGTEMIVRDILRRDPNHPGAHHTRIHNWDGDLAEQAMASCDAYGRIVPGIGHAKHMPGHNYSKIGMWHEAARSMDAATRVELRYMNERLALPFETWNYPHNRNYLCYIQEQLGMASASLQGAADLLAAPRDPELNKEGGYSLFDQGLTAQVRALVKFERWDDILKPGTIQWRDDDFTKIQRAYVETLAYIGQGKKFDARNRLAELKELIRGQAGKTEGGGRVLDSVAEKSMAEEMAMVLHTAEGLLCAAEGNLLDATRFLTDAAAIEKKQRDAGQYPNDPPHSPWPLNRLLGDVYFKAGEPRLAIEAYDRGLKQEPNDAFALAGLAQAHFKLGNREKAAEYAGRFAYVWSSCDPGLRWKAEVDALGLNAAPIAVTPAQERPYTLDTQADLGPLDWEPFAAPKLDCLDTDGKTVRLDDFLGKNVLLVFYLGDECPHCVEQLVAINARASEWEAENTVVLAVSSATPEKNKSSDKLSKLSTKLLSDRDHENARRFTSYDDFEEIELHSTILIDTKGRVHWKRTGGDPFTDMEFLMQSLKRMNGRTATTQAAK